MKEERMKWKAVKAILACVALAGCGPEFEAWLDEPSHCRVTEWYQVPGISDRGSLGAANGVIVKGVVANCPSRTEISVRGYDSEGKLVGVGNDTVRLDVFSVFVETLNSSIENIKFKFFPRYG